MTATDLRALSIRNPWAALIMGGHKLVENRTWDTSLRGAVVVHAGQKVDQWAAHRAAAVGVVAPFPGGYLGLVDLVDVHYSETGLCCGEWAEPHAYHWQLRDPRPFLQPIPGPGRLGLYRCPPEVTAATQHGESV
jgi:ASCH domain-containing protein